MIIPFKAHVAIAALFAMGASAILSHARADVADYAFQLVETSYKAGEAIIAVRLVNKKTGQPIPDAVFVATRIDMAPDGMATMTSPIAPAPAAEPGVYRFKTNLAMEGGRRLSLAAKVQGETGTVESRLILKAVK